MSLCGRYPTQLLLSPLNAHALLSNKWPYKASSLIASRRPNCERAVLFYAEHVSRILLRPLGFLDWPYNSEDHALGTCGLSKVMLNSLTITASSLQSKRRTSLSIFKVRQKQGTFVCSCTPCRQAVSGSCHQTALFLSWVPTK